jgi:hypothetical protein
VPLFSRSICAASIFLLAETFLLPFSALQVDVKNYFLNSVIQKEVFVTQPLRFENPKYPNSVYKLSNALYELKQAPRAWYARLKKFLLEHGYVMGSVDKIIFTLNHDTDFLLVQIYVDDIIFGDSSHTLVFRFQEMIKNEFQISMMGELTFFLGIQSSKRNKVPSYIKHVSIPMSTATSLGLDEDGESVN